MVVDAAGILRGRASVPVTDVRTKRALSAGHSTKAGLKAKATDASGNDASAKRTVKLRP